MYSRTSMKSTACIRPKVWTPRSGRKRSFLFQVERQPPSSANLWNTIESIPKQVLIVEIVAFMSAFVLTRWLTLIPKTSAKNETHISIFFIRMFLHFVCVMWNFHESGNLTSYRRQRSLIPRCPWAKNSNRSDYYYRGEVLFGIFHSLVIHD